MSPSIDQLPSALTAAARWERLGASRIPAMLVHPDRASGTVVPVLIWMHGRTARKEIDPGRFLRLMRSGIGACAVDLPGHGERYDAALQAPACTLDVVLQMIDEIDEVIDAVRGDPGFDANRMVIGGMSAGGMVTLARLCHDHPFRAAAVEAATGSWEHQRHRPMFRDHEDDVLSAVNPIENLDGWREIPLQAIHCVRDEWVGFDGQKHFLDTLRSRYREPGRVELVVYEETGAPYEHAGFGRMAADAKNRQRDFLLGALGV